MHFKGKYVEYPDLPIWTATEVMSFGSLSWMIDGMSTSDKKAISSRYALQPSTLASWSHHLSYIRNMCAHHCRIWDRLWSVKPELPAGNSWLPPFLASNGKLTATLYILKHMLDKCTGINSYAIEWRDRVTDLLQKLPNTPLPEMKIGLSPDWHKCPLWTK